MGTLKLVALSAWCALGALGQTIPVNYPSLHGFRFINLSLDGFHERPFPRTTAPRSR